MIQLLGTRFSQLGRGVAFAGAFVLAIVVSATTHAQGITPEVLIGDAVSNAKDPKYSEITEAIQRYTANDALGARQFLETAKRKDDKLPPVDMMMAKLYMVTGQSNAFLVSLEATIREHPTDPEPYLLLADHSMASNQAIQAAALYDKAIELLATYDHNLRRKQRFVERAYSGRAGVYQRWGFWDKAEADLRSWIEANPEDSNAYNRLGIVLFQLGKDRDGYQAFLKAKELNSDMPNPFIATASMYQRLDKNTEAKEAFERAYKNDSTDRLTIIAYSEWLIRQGQLDQAAKILEEGMKSHPDVFEIALLRGVAAQMMEDSALAEAEYNRALAISPGNRDAMNQLALLLVNQEDSAARNRAEMLAKINAKLNEQNPDVFITLAWVLRQQNKMNDANQAYQKGIRLGRLSGDSTLLVAKLLQERGQSDVAKNILQNALEKEEGIFVNRAEAEAFLQTLN